MIGLIYRTNMKRYANNMAGGFYRVPLNRLGLTSTPKQVNDMLFGSKSIWIRKGASRW